MCRTVRSAMAFTLTSSAYVHTVCTHWPTGINYDATSKICHTARMGNQVDNSVLYTQSREVGGCIGWVDWSG